MGGWCRASTTPCHAWRTLLLSPSPTLRQPASSRQHCCPLAAAAGLRLHTLGLASCAAASSATGGPATPHGSSTQQAPSSMTTLEKPRSLTWPSKKASMVSRRASSELISSGVMNSLSAWLSVARSRNLGGGGEEEAEAEEQAQESKAGESGGRRGQQGQGREVAGRDHKGRPTWGRNERGWRTYVWRKHACSNRRGRDAPAGVAAAAGW